MTTKKRIHDLLNPGDRRDGLSQAVNFFIIALIFINVLSASLETVKVLHDSYKLVFWVIELFSVAVFTIEYVLRLWSVTESKNFKNRQKFVFSFDSIIDLLAIAPFYISILTGIDLKALIALRLLRLLKLVRYFEPLAILANVMKAEFRAFMAAMFVLLILVFIAATGIYFFERHAQPEVFGNIPESMWWAIVTLTTLGYGDVVPVTVAGRVFAALITILSIGTVALPAGMLASRFSEELRKRKDEMEQKIAYFAADGELSDIDKQKLEYYRDKLCLSDDDMKKLVQKLRQNQEECPICGKGKNNE